MVNQMLRSLTIACILFSIATGAVAILLTLRDREETLRIVGERTASLSRMIMAHGDAAADSAIQIINTTFPVVEAWDLEESGTGRMIAARFKEMVDSSRLISSAWVVNAAGVNIADSWGYPPKPVVGADRPYFKAHLAGEDGPFVASDDRPGPISGKERFTISRAIRQPGGKIKAIIAVGIYKDIFNALYTEAATWPGARAGLFTMSGDLLASIKGEPPASSRYIQSVISLAAKQPSGTAIIREGSDSRIVSWQRSQSHPQLYASSSQPVGAALSLWRDRAWAIALLVLGANIVFWILAYLAYRSETVRQAALANELAVREVNHRIKNSLQLISSLMQLRSRKTEDTAYQNAVRDVTAQLMALAETYRFVQTSTALETVDAVKSIRGLCKHLEGTYGIPITVAASGPAVVHANHASALSIIVNELVTNAIKHGGGSVRLVLAQDSEELRISVSAPKALPEGFNLEETQGFGLKAVRSMLSSLDGQMTATNRPGAGAVFTVAVPLVRLKSP